MDQIYHSLFGCVDMRNAVILPPTDESIIKDSSSITKDYSENVNNENPVNVSENLPSANDFIPGFNKKRDKPDVKVTKNEIKKENFNRKKEFCFCRKQESPRMIGCDHCDEWYHLECLNLTKKKAKRLARKDWACPNCAPNSSSLSKTGIKHDIDFNNNEAIRNEVKRYQTQNIELPLQAKSKSQNKFENNSDTEIGNDLFSGTTLQEKMFKLGTDAKFKPEARRSKRNRTEIGRLQINHTHQNNEPSTKRPTLYDENGILIAVNKDLCDCLNESCPGCHFECPKCQSPKCGHKCRNNRNWMVISSELEVLGYRKINPYWDVVYGQTDEANNFESRIAMEK